MSRSVPDQHIPHPAKRFFEWDGANGHVRYYDKETKKNVDIGDSFAFLLLDRLSTVKGWHENSESGIFSNEVRDTRADVMVVKAFKGGPIAEGLYAQIRDRVLAAGGYFVTNLYIAFKENGALQIGSIIFKGAALGAWMDFEKKYRADLYAKAIRIKGSTEGKKGKVVFKMPKFGFVEISEADDNEAKALDVTLQEYLKAYFARTKVDQVNQTSQHAPEDENQEHPDEPRDTRDHSQDNPDPDLEPANDEERF